MRKEADALASFEERILAFARESEFGSFWLAVVLSSKMEEGLSAQESGELKSRIKRELGGKLEARWGKKSIRASHDSPDVLFTLDFHSGRLRAEVKPLLFYGRYRKLSREIPQSKWPCKRCGGRGCARCGGKGAMYPETVEGFLAAPLLGRAGAAESKMHAAGREDVDARMLGAGRPFVLEIVGPKRRRLDLGKAAAEANRAAEGKASFSRLSPAAGKDVEAVKAAQPDKTYRLEVSCPKRISDSLLKRLQQLKGKTISQATPQRVLHRRPDLVRKRKVRSVSVKRMSPKSFLLTVRAQSGTYVKELVTGDSGRTRPSVSSLLGCACAPKNLDVLKVWFRRAR
ncbi:MAG: tRNA pseudouridine(54/55) synthase Pus10 [Candidatus ainarchaeum sp.]|nr:tRNA pseudouridine(54/55) synthase Pus10 [Candidatus ainarchaeum sp.]